jgi:crotonobetainyl-CoA dehydrogenase
MGYKLTEDQQLIVAAMTNLMTSENWDDYFRECDEKHVFPERFCIALGELGIHGLLNPPEHGGLDENAMTTFTAAWEEILRMGGNAACIWASTTYPVVLREGNQKQIDIANRLMATNKVLICNSATEPGAGSDLGAMTTTYTLKDGKYYLNGQKTFATDALYSEYIILTALDAETKTKYTNFFFRADLPGITINPLDKLGLRTNSACEIYLDNVEIELDDMLGEEGKGFDMQKNDFNVERVISGLYCYGYAYCAYEDAAKYANQRVQFGQPIARQAVIQWKLGEMAIKLENMKNMIYEGSERVDNNTLEQGYAAMCKYYCVRAAEEVCNDAIQILGGIGICGEHRAARAWRDCRASRISGGTDEMMMRTLGRTIVKKYRQ